MQLLFRVAFFAGRYAVALRAFAAASHGDNMVHGELFSPEFLAAIMAKALPQEVLPPL